METNKIQNNKITCLSDDKSNHQLTQEIPVSSQDGLHIDFQDTEIVEEETTYQRRPQFRLNERSRRGYL